MFAARRERREREASAKRSTVSGSAAVSSAPKPPREQLPLKQRVQKVVDGSVFTTVMTVATVYALFGDDIRLWLTPQSVDIVFDLFTSISFFLFIIELILQSWVVDGYLAPPDCKNEKYHNWKRFYNMLFFGSFYFWLDLIATASLIPEIPWIVGETEDTIRLVGTTSDLDPENPDTVRATRASRAGARAGRVVRVIRLVRLFRVVKVYKYLKESRARQAELRRAEEEALRKGLVPADMEEEEPEQGKDEGSRVGAALSDLTTRRVIVGVLVMLICIPLLMYSVFDNSDDIRLQMLHGYSRAWVVEPDVYEESYAAAINNLGESYKLLDDDGVWTGESELLYLCSNGTLLNGPCIEEIEMIEELRVPELSKLRSTSVVDGVDYVTDMWISKKAESVETALWGIILTAFVIVVLGTASMLFSRDAQTLVLAPVEKMVEVVTEISKNPLVQLDETNAKDFKEGMETTLLLDTIKKIGGLLRVGFGEAGAAVIADNLNESAELNPLAPGKMVHAIFGFCDIRKFTDTTECLQQEVMLFVNRIADVVHGLVVQGGGAANKNIGDAFLLTWKFDREKVTKSDLHDAAALLDPWAPRPPPEEVVERARADEAAYKRAVRERELRLQEKQRAAIEAGEPVRTEDDEPDVEPLLPSYTVLADRALIAFLKCMAESGRTPEFYKMSSRAAERLYTAMPGYKVRMGFGLTWGWAIEGAIGSDKKIDASYLSPHVKMSERLEGGTKAYGVPLLMTGEFFALLSPVAQSLCRHIDHATVPAQTEPLDLYAYDCDLTADFWAAKLELTEKRRKAWMKKHRHRHHHHHHHHAHGHRANPAGGAGGGGGGGSSAGAADSGGPPAGAALRSTSAVGDEQEEFTVMKEWEYEQEYSQAMWVEDPDLVVLLRQSTHEFRQTYEAALKMIMGKRYRRANVVQGQDGAYRLPTDEDIAAGHVGVEVAGKDPDEVAALNKKWVVVADWREAERQLEKANQLYRERSLELRQQAQKQAETLLRDVETAEAHAKAGSATDAEKEMIKSFRSKAAARLEEAESISLSDGATNAMLAYIRATDCVVPETHDATHHADV